MELLVNLKIEEEDWIIVDPKDNDLRETATSNLIFARQKTLIIPDKYVLNGIVLQNLLPFLRNQYSVIHALPKDHEISSFDEIILCGTGRGVAPLTSLTELGWSSGGNEIFSTIRNHYEEIIKSASAKYLFNGYSFPLRYPAVMGILNLTPILLVTEKFP